MNARRFAALSAIAVALAVASPAGVSAPAAAAAVPGDAIVAAAEGDAQIVWDSTPDVEDIVKNKLDDKAANALLERDALRVIAANLKDLKKATSITVHVHYNKTGLQRPNLPRRRALRTRHARCERCCRQSCQMATARGHRARAGLRQI